MAAERADEVSGYDVLEILAEQHQRMRQLLAQLVGGGGTDRKRPFADLQLLLQVHEETERAVVGPMLGDQGTRASDQLGRLAGLGMGSAEFRAGLGRLAEDVLAHAARQESGGFPIVRARLDASQRDWLGQQLLVAQWRSSNRIRPAISDPP